MKGITPIMASILLMMITISILALSYDFFTSIFKTVSMKSESYMKSKILVFGRIVIDNINENSITIRNIGAFNVSTTSIAVYVNDKLITCNWDKKIVKPRELATCYKSNFCRKGDFIKITSPSNVDEGRCP